MLRDGHETVLIREALKRGQPILAICAGAWKLWVHAGGLLTEVVDHCSMRMPNIKPTTGKVGYNMQLHRINFTPDGLLLKAAMKCEVLDEAPKVNSVHWLAVDPTHTPENFSISATARSDETIHAKSRGGKILSPEENSVEAFESTSGAPILGIQWHPEAYTQPTKGGYAPDSHQAIIRYLKKAGTVYKLKRILLSDITRYRRDDTQLHTDASLGLRNTGLFQYYKRRDFLEHKNVILALAAEKSRQRRLVKVKVEVKKRCVKLEPRTSDIRKYFAN